MKKNKVLLLPNAKEEAFFRYRDLFLKEGYEEKEAYLEPFLRFSALSKGNDGIFLTYFFNTNEFFAVGEEDCHYFSRKNEALPTVTSPKITQLHLTDFGLSYVVCLSDGRFVVFDGGWNTPEDRKSLYDCLTAQSNGKMPRIACWILTHPHGDHHRCFNGFWEDYEGKVALDAVLMHLPAADDTDHYPKLALRERGECNMDQIRKNYEWIQRLGAELLTAHTGQTYFFGDARFRILICMENTISISNNINATSLVMKMELGKTSVLWTGDAYCKFARLADRYGDFLKSDILQVFHHGFSSGSAQEVIDAYNAIRAAVCLLPASDRLAFSTFCIHQKATRYLYEAPSTQEVITGETSRTITLPYLPSPDGKERLQRQMKEGLALCGKTLWEIPHADQSEYTLRNITFAVATVTLKESFPSEEMRESILSVPKLGTLSVIPSEGAEGFVLECSIPLQLEF